MKKLTKKLLIGVLSFAFVIGTSLGAINISTAAYTATADAAQGVSAQNLALSADNWTNASAFTSKTDGLYANSNNVYAITKTQFGADNTLSFETVGTLTDATWCWSWLVLKQSEPNADFDASSKNISGNAVVFLYGGSEGTNALYEFVDGELKTTQQLYFDGNNVWYPYKFTTKISATIKDTDAGYDLSITLAAGDNTTETKTYSSTTTELKGNGYAQFGYRGSGTISETSNFVLTDFTVTGDTVTPSSEPTELAPTLTNLATSASNFSGGCNTTLFTFSDTGAVASGTPGARMSISLAKDVKKDSTIAVDILGHGNTNWGEGWIIFKDVSVTQVVSPDQNSDTLTSDMNYLAFRWGNSCLAQIDEVADGVLTTTSISGIGGDGWEQDDYKSFYNEGNRTRILITTEDTTTGVKVNITFENYTAGKTLTYEYNSTNTKLHGDYAMNVGNFTGIATTETIEYRKIAVTETVEKIDRSGLLNMATSLDYAKDALAGNAFSYVDKEGLVLEGATKAGMLMYKPVASGQKVTLQWNNTLTGASWGNCYLVIKNMTGKYVNVPATNEIATYNATSDANDNWIAVLFSAGDGLQLYVCIGGQIEKISLGNAEDNNDVWYWYKQATTATITATDVAATDDDDAHILIEFTLVGPSGKLSAKSYSIYDDIDAFYGKDGLFEYQYFVGAGGNIEGNNDYICLQRLVYSGVESLTLPDIDITEINTTLASYTAIDATNYETAKAYYERIETAKTTFNYTLNKNFNTDAFIALGNSIAAYETEVEDAEAVATKINALPTEVTADNYQSTKSLITSIESDYAALSESGKALVTGYDKVATVKAAIETYESTLGGNSSDNGNSSGNDNGSKGGCGGTIISSSVIAAFGLTALGGVELLKKKKD